MKNCKEIKDLILTDYIDEQIDQATKSRVETHLLSCPDCQAFSQEVKSSLVVPFEQAERQAVPAHLWNSIKEKIEEKEYAVASNPFEKLLELLFPRLVPAFASVAILILVGSFVFHDQLVKRDQAKAQEKYLVSLLSTAEDNSDGLGTTIEEYFL